MKIISSLN